MSLKTGESLEKFHKSGQIWVNNNFEVAQQNKELLDFNFKFID